MKSNKNNKNTKGLKPVMQNALQAVMKFLKAAVTFINKHKIVSIITATVVFVSAVGFGVARHYLNQINYSNAGSTQALYSGPTTIKLASGETVDLTVLPKKTVDSYLMPDGRIVDTDGSVWYPNGAVLFYDGSYLTENGEAVLSDGTTIYKNSTVIFQDGDYLKKTGIKVDKQGYATFKKKGRRHISTFTISKKGKIIVKPDSEVAQRYIADDENIILENYSEDVKKALEANDKEIKRNFDDKKIWYSDQVMNIMVLGIDEGSANYPFGRSDAMILVSINKSTKKVKLISLSRAAYVAIQGYNNTRLSHAHGYGGAALAIDTIERNYKIKIDNYVSTNFTTFRQLIDAIGGVSIKLTADEAKALKGKIQQAGVAYNGAGVYNLNGNLALEYVRLRKIDSDHARTQRQRNVLSAIASKAKSMNIMQLNSTLNTILPLITTDLSSTQIFSQAVNLPFYLTQSMSQYVIPHNATSLTLVDQFEVLLLKWDKEVEYLHDIVYEGVTPSYYEK